MFIQRHKLIMLALLSTFLIFLGGCAGSSSTGQFSQNGQSSEQQGKKEILVGYSISLTGKYSTEGNETDRSYKLWADGVNKADGIFIKDLNRKLPVRLISYDDASDTTNALKNYDKLITKDGVDLVLSPWGSGHNFAVTPQTEKYKYPIVLSSAAADNIFNRGFKYIFATTQLSSHLHDSTVNYLSTQKDKIKSVAIAYENFLFTQSLHDALKPKLEQAGFNLVADEQYPMGAQDFTGLLAKIASAKPDAFIVLNIMPTSVYITKQLRETAGYQPKYYQVNLGPTYTKEFIDQLGQGAEGVLETGFWHRGLPFAGAEEFAVKFEKMYQKEPSTDASYAYIATQVLQQAIEKAGTLDREKITQVLRTEKFSTVLGPFEYDEKGVNKNQEVFLTQVQDGKRYLVWPKEVAQKEIRMPGR